MVLSYVMMMTGFFNFTAMVCGTAACVFLGEIVSVYVDAHLLTLTLLEVYMTCGTSCGMLHLFEYICVDVTLMNICEAWQRSRKVHWQWKPCSKKGRL